MLLYLDVRSYPRVSTVLPSFRAYISNLSSSSHDIYQLRSGSCLVSFAASRTGSKCFVTPARLILVRVEVGLKVIYLKLTLLKSKKNVSSELDFF